MRTKRKPLAVVGLLALSLATPGSAQTKANQSTGTRASSTSVPMPKTDRMSMATFQSLLAKGKVVVIDVRSSDSYAAGHIPGALSIPEESINSVTAEKLIRMGKAIATYCT